MCVRCRLTRFPANATLLYPNVIQNFKNSNKKLRDSQKAGTVFEIAVVVLRPVAGAGPDKYTLCAVLSYKTYDTIWECWGTKVAAQGSMPDKKEGIVGVRLVLENLLRATARGLGERGMLAGVPTSGKAEGEWADVDFD